MAQVSLPPLGVILAGGRGRRAGGDKARLELGGRPLMTYPLAALRAAVGEVVVQAKPATRLPENLDVPVWREAPTPQHPLVGIVHALREAQGRPVLVCAADLPFVSPEVLRELAGAEPGPAVVAAHAGDMQPQLARYDPSALDRLARVAAEARLPLRQAVNALSPRLVEVPSEQLFNVNTLDDLAQAEEILTTQT